MLIVTHQAPDLDAITSSWLLLRFDAQHYAGSRFAFVPAGTALSDQAAAALGYSPDQVTHVDTGQGKFDHHSPERAGKEFSATSLVYQHCLKIHPELKNDEALKLMVDHVTDVDHFGEAFWPDANHPRYEFMLHQIIAAMDLTATHDDTYQLELGTRLLDFVYQAMRQHTHAAKLLTQGITFPLKNGDQAFAIETSNDEILSFAQRSNFSLALKKDAKNGQVRIKARPDVNFNLHAVYQDIIKQDKIGTWYYHPSGLMLINGSRKSPHHVASPLTLDQLIKIIKEHL
jgi:hypothetical protein